MRTNSHSLIYPAKSSDPSFLQYPNASLNKKDFLVRLSTELVVRQKETNTDKCPGRRGRIPDRIIFTEGPPKGDGKTSGAPISGSTS
ncbi:hypothetical protein CEXT_275581 [Caerostris extrusa]|uniref:Uncharacterized protein n=1 Tax=Caerostris extrusa TaxID=172846 RepID=A0AAV4PG59_CAEEX|nr:hypothetical protein CEXT_275581 [Caerostris extrusa]